MCDVGQGYLDKGGAIGMSKPAREAIAGKLRRLLITGELVPGSLLSEADLCGLLSCSRTPLREALRQLSHEYLVVLPPRRNVLIPHLGVTEFQQANEAARFIEGICIGLAAERIDEQQLKEMMDIVAQQRAANEVRAFYDLAELDREFHTAIAKATRNRHFFDAAARLHSFFARFTYQAYKASGSGGLSIAEHGGMVEALEERDIRLAQQRLDEHTTKGGQRILAILGLGEEAPAFLSSVVGQSGTLVADGRDITHSA
jgi:DNA-binding GntR family transcriptional regulator